MAEYRIKADMLLCQGHGVCTEECPEIFTVVDTGSGYPKVRIKNATPPDDLRDKVQAAVDYCPNRTLKIVAID